MSFMLNDCDSGSILFPRVVRVLALKNRIGGRARGLIREYLTG